jgi:FixJ family two-component response regulator
MAQAADERMWCEVLNEGAWDCLAKPFHEKEVFLTVSSAWRNWKEERDRVLGRLARSAASGGAGLQIVARA